MFKYNGGKVIEKKLVVDLKVTILSINMVDVMWQQLEARQLKNRRSRNENQEKKKCNKLRNKGMSKEIHG
jgi:hypothetical protein